MVDSVLLLVDAVEGPMPQTRFVTSKALAAGLKPIVVVNKADRDAARPDWAVDETFDLFDRLGANEEQLDFPVVYASAIEGWATADLSGPKQGMTTLFQTIVDHDFYGKELKDISTAAFRWEDLGEDWICREGFGALVAHYGRDVPVELNTEVTKIDWSGNDVRVATSNGTLDGKAVILTASTGVLASGKIQFDPVLPLEKAEAINAFTMGVYNHEGWNKTLRIGPFHCHWRLDAERTCSGSGH